METAFADAPGQLELLASLILEPTALELRLTAESQYWAPTLGPLELSQPAD